MSGKKRREEEEETTHGPAEKYIRPPSLPPGATQAVELSVRDMSLSHISSFYLMWPLDRPFLFVSVFSFPFSHTLSLVLSRSLLRFQNASMRSPSALVS